MTRATKGQPPLANSHATFGRENWYVTTPNNRRETAGGGEREAKGNSGIGSGLGGRGGGEKKIPG